MGQQRHLWVRLIDRNCSRLYTRNAPGFRFPKLVGVRFNRNEHSQFFSDCENHEYGRRHPEHHGRLHLAVAVCCFRSRFHQHCSRQLCQLQRYVYPNGSQCVFRKVVFHLQLKHCGSGSHPERHRCRSEWNERQLFCNDLLRFQFRK